MRRQILFALALLCANPLLAYCGEMPDASPEKAVQLVLQTQADKIRSVDNPADWWRDTKERTWSVRRPAEPGVLDTTHTFVVSYKIDGVAVASWQVDTKAGTTVGQP